MYVWRNLSYLAGIRKHKVYMLPCWKACMTSIILDNANHSSLVILSQSPTSPVQNLALDRINSLIIDPTIPTWTFERNTSPYNGQGNYVISIKRCSSAQSERTALSNTMGTMLETEITVLKTQVETLQQELLVNTKAIMADIHLKVGLILQLLGYVAEP